MQSKAETMKVREWWRAPSNSGWRFIREAQEAHGEQENILITDKQKLQTRTAKYSSTQLNLWALEATVKKKVILTQ